MFRHAASNSCRGSRSFRIGQPNWNRAPFTGPPPTPTIAQETSRSHQVSARIFVVGQLLNGRGFASLPRGAKTNGEHSDAYLIGGSPRGGGGTRFGPRAGPDRSA